MRRGDVIGDMDRGMKRGEVGWPSISGQDEVIFDSGVDGCMLDLVASTLSLLWYASSTSLLLLGCGSKPNVMRPIDSWLLT